MNLPAKRKKALNLWVSAFSTQQRVHSERADYASMTETFFFVRLAHSNFT